MLAKWNRDFGWWRNAAVRSSTLFDFHIIEQIGDGEGAAEEHQFGGEIVSVDGYRRGVMGDDSETKS